MLTPKYNSLTATSSLSFDKQGPAAQRPAAEIGPQGLAAEALGGNQDLGPAQVELGQGMKVIARGGAGVRSRQGHEARFGPIAVPGPGADSVAGFGVQCKVHAVAQYI